MSALTNIIGWIGTGFAFFVFYSPYKMLTNALKQKQGKTTELGESSIDLSSIIPFPYLAMCISALLWVTYGVIIEDMILVITNLVGFIASCYYNWLYYRITDKKEEFISKCSIGLVTYISSLSFVLFVAPSHKVVSYLGVISAIGSVVMFGSPLVTIKQVLEKQNSESIQLLLAIASASCSLTWLLYGLLISNSAIYVPNGVGLILACIQLALKYLYRRNISGPKVFSLSRNGGQEISQTESV